MSQDNATPQPQTLGERYPEEEALWYQAQTAWMEMVRIQRNRIIAEHGGETPEALAAITDIFMQGYVNMMVVQWINHAPPGASIDKIAYIVRRCFGSIAETISGGNLEALIRFTRTNLRELPAKDDNHATN